MSDTSQTKTVLDESSENTGKKRDRSASEDRLIKAGIDIFSKYGFNGCTTRMISEKADVNESLIGRYFDGKEGLLLAIIEIFIKDIKSEEIPYPPEATVREELRKYVLAKLKDSKKNECLGKIIISHAMTNPKFRKKALAKIPIFTDAHLLTRLENLAKQGQINADQDLKSICEEIEAYLHGVFVFDLILREMPNEDVAKRALAFIDRYSKSLI